MLTQDQISAAVADSMPNILAGLKEEITNRAIHEAREAAAALVKKTVTEWVSAQLVPEITKILTENKEGLVSIAPKLAAGITDTLAESVLASFKEKLEKSWTRQEVFKVLFA